MTRRIDIIRKIFLKTWLFTKYCFKHECLCLTEKCNERTPHFMTLFSSWFRIIRFFNLIKIKSPHLLIFLAPAAKCRDLILDWAFLSLIFLSTFFFGTYTWKITNQNTTNISSVLIGRCKTTNTNTLFKVCDWKSCLSKLLRERDRHEINYIAFFLLYMYHCNGLLIFTKYM